MKKLIVLFVLVAFAGYAIAEIPPLNNAGFENTTGGIADGWGVWGSGSGSGPSGAGWKANFGYVDTTGNAYDGQNFFNLTTSEQIGYCEYSGWGWTVTWPNGPGDTAPVTEGDGVTIGAWAKDVLENGSRLQIRFEWMDSSGRIAEQGGIVPREDYYFDLTTDWAYYEVSTLSPVDAFSVYPAWANPDPGQEAGIDNLVFVPEPISIALLGLGGLLLRRKK